MRIDQIDLFYLAIPNVTRAADGTQDTVLVRIRDESGREGWGECDGGDGAGYFPEDGGGAGGFQEVPGCEQVGDACLQQDFAGAEAGVRGLDQQREEG